MGKSKIEWTDATWNPVTGCTKVSTGCKHCYAERLFPRVYGKDKVTFYTGEGEFTRPRMFTDVKLHPERLDAPLHWKKPRMIFVNSMSDLFHEDVPFDFIDKIFDVMANSEGHTFQILTKRPARMREWFNFNYKNKSWKLEEWPLPNVWLGISCENQETADERIPILLQVPSAVRFLSCEPLIDEIDFRIDGVYPGRFFGECGSAGGKCYDNTCRTKIDWVIVGGESGPGYRPMKPEWAKSIIEQCQDAMVPVFMKQMAGKKEIPEDLKIREYPKNNGG